MKNQLEITKVSRRSLEKIVGRYTLDQCNKIPPGFSNNLIWNVAHIIVTQQLLVYGRSNLSMLVSKNRIDKYKKGTKAAGDCSQEERDEIMNLLHTSIEKTAEDWRNGVFQSYTPYKTSLGFEIQNLEDAMAFNNFHEGIHLGYIMALKKSL